MPYAALSAALLLCAALALLSGPPVDAAQSAIAADGSTAFLRDDGTWLPLAKSPRAAGRYTFRSTYWGMSRADVIASEVPRLGQPTGSEGESVGYEETLDGLRVYLVYDFASGRLVRGYYALNEHHGNRNDYIADYRRLRRWLVARHGEPVDDQMVWRDNLHRDDPEHWGLAVSVGHLTLLCAWETPATTIHLLLRGEDYRESLTLVYESKVLAGAETGAGREAEKF